MAGRFFRTAAVALAFGQIGALGCNRDNRNRTKDERPSGSMAPSTRPLLREPAIGGGPRSADDGGVDDRGLEEFELEPGGSTGRMPSGSSTTGTMRPYDTDLETTGSGSTRSGTTTSGSRL